VPLSDLALEIIKEAAADEGKPQERGAHLEARQWHNLLRYPIAERVALRADDEHTDRSLFEKIAGEFEISRGRSKWEGSATELLKALSALIGEPANKEKTWPKQPNALSGKLRRAAPPLRKIGIHIDFVREDHDSTKVITIKARGQPQGDSKTSPASSANGKNPSEINETNTINAGDPPTIPTATIVGNKPLKNNKAGDANDADDLLHTPSAAKVCAQCNAGPSPGSDAPTIRLADGAWVHTGRCRQFWIDEHPQTGE
jgi:hypothetical protein